MLENDPPPGTQVRMVREVKKARTGNIAKLVRAVRKYDMERPEDEFIIEFEGEQITVQRRDIEKAL